jgi:hypothetical protein
MLYAFWDNVWVQSWNRSGIGFPGIEAVEKGAVITMGFSQLFTEVSSSLIGANRTHPTGN